MLGRSRLLRVRASDPTRLSLSVGKIILRCSAPAYASEWIAVREKSKNHLTRWEPDWPSDEVTITAIRRRMKQQQRAIRAGQILPLFIFKRPNIQCLNIQHQSIQGVDSADDKAFGFGEVANDASHKDHSMETVHSGDKKSRFLGWWLRPSINEPLGQLVGGVTLSGVKRHASHSAQIGYWVGNEFLRQGFGRAAVKAVVNYGLSVMGLHRIEAACQPDNWASRGLLETVGFRQEGLARQYLNINGKWRDHCLYAITAPDFEELREKHANGVVNL